MSAMDQFGSYSILLLDNRHRTTAAIKPDSPKLRTPAPAILQRSRPSNDEGNIATAAAARPAPCVVNQHPLAELMSKLIGAARLTKLETLA